LKQWHVRDVNFCRGKSRIFITFKGMEGILSNFIGIANDFSSHVDSSGNDYDLRIF
jgi:hypothetical protein